MPKKSISVFVLAFFFFGFNLARAGDVIINEIQILPTGNKFLELYNTGDSAVDLTGWYIKKKTASGAESSLVVSARLQDKSISPKNYFLIANEEEYTGNGVLDAGWPKSNTGVASNNTVIVYDSNDIEVDKVGWGEASDCPSSCPSNPPSDQSIQKTISGWITASPTPGEENDAVTSQPADDSSSSESSSSSSSSLSVNTPETKIKVVENPTMKAKILASTPAFTGQPLEMKTNISGFSNENVVLGRAFWNFGDGGSLVQVDNFEKFYHTYYYPGEYVLFLEYYQNSFSKTPETTSKMIIKVLPTTVTISKVGDAKDFFIELSNNAGSDMDISNWVINAGGKIFILPKNSVILSKKQMTISSKITGFTYGDQYDLKLFSSTGELVFDYSSPIKPVKILTKNSVPIKISTAVKPLEGMSSGGQIPTEDLSALPIASLVGSASALNNGILGQEGKSSYSLPIISLIFLVFVGVGAGGVYFIRRKKVISQVGSDFEILDE